MTRRKSCRAATVRTDMPHAAASVLRIIMVSSSRRTIALAALVSFLLFATNVAKADNVDDDEQFNKKDWYTRYPAYPEYCSTFDQMKSRSIPALTESNKYGETRLVHASVVIRHGARTPWGNDMKCWKGYWSEETGVWNCRLQQLVAPPSDATVEKEEDQDADKSSNAVFLFQKQYDAFSKEFHPNNSHGGTAASEGLSNKLNGTCQVGQLLLQGYEQQITNGQFLKDAYCYEGDDDYNHDVRMRLIDVSAEQPWQQLWYRADDDERTVMSGQVLLRGMLEEQFQQYIQKHNKQHPTIVLHTADRDQDILSPSNKVCPKLKQLWQEAQDSKEFQQFNHSKSSRKVRVYQRHHLGQVMDKSPVDCLMTTICNDRPLPEAINDYHGGSQANFTDVQDEEDADDGWFQKIAQYSIKSFIFPFLYNNAAYSKLGIAPLWREIMNHILPVIHPELYDEYNQAPTIPRLALFSGHDTSIIPLMASLSPKLWNDTDWPPYASMMIIEIHEVIDGLTDRTIFTTNFAFRLLYNGRVMTGLVNGCREELDLCDAKILEQQVKNMAMEPWKCDATPTSTFTTAWAETKVLLSTTGGVVLVFLLVLLSGAVGGVGMYIYLTRRLPCSGKHFQWLSAPRPSPLQRFSYEGGISLTEQDLNHAATVVAAEEEEPPSTSSNSLYGSADTTEPTTPTAVL